jgi:hypothetical protein
LHIRKNSRHFRKTLAFAERVADSALLATLAVDFETIWTAPSTGARLKKRIILVIADIDPTADDIVPVVYWTGGGRGP